MACLTGGTGFVGRHCVVALLAAGWRVRLLARRVVQVETGVELVLGDLDDQAALSRLVAGADVVLHIAGLVKAATAAAFDAVNCAGTARLAAVVARENPAARFVLISSQVARAPGLSAYAASKHAAEQAAIAALGACVILRPGVVYGPCDIEGTAVLRLARRRIVPVPADPEPRLAMIHARDAADAIVAFCAAGPTGTYELSDGAADGHGWRDIVRSAATRPPRFVRIPDAAIRCAGAVTDAWARLTGRPAIFGRGKAREILHRDWRPDPALRIPPTLWGPRINLADGMRDTIAWWEQSRR